MQGTVPAGPEVIDSLPALRVLHKFDSRLTPMEDNIIGSFILVIGIFGVVLNSWLLKGFYKERKTLKPPTYFLANLCVSDLITLFCAYPCSFTSFFAHGWAFGEGGCTFYGAVSYFSGTAGIYSLTAIAFMRYIKTCHPNGGQWLHSKRSTMRLIGFIYGFSLFWAMLPCLGWGSYEIEPIGLACTLNWWTQEENEIVQLLLACIFICFIPIGLMVFFYFNIHRRVRASSRNLARHTRATEKTVRFVRNNSIVSETRITLVSATLCLGMIIAWLPYTIVCLISVFAGKDYIPVRLTVIPLILAKASHGYNPLIYFLMTRERRNKIKRLLRCRAAVNEDERPFTTQTHNFRINTATQFPSPVLIPGQISRGSQSTRAPAGISSRRGSSKTSHSKTPTSPPTISSTMIPSPEAKDDGPRQRQYTVQHHILHQHPLVDDCSQENVDQQSRRKAQPISCLTVAVLVSSTSHVASTSTGGGVQSCIGPLGEPLVYSTEVGDETQQLTTQNRLISKVDKV